MTRNTRYRWWTVMLLYPDYLTDDYGSEIFVEWARTATAEEAVPVVQRKAVDAQHTEQSKHECVEMDPADFKMIAVWRGRTTLALDGYSTV